VDDNALGHWLSALDTRHRANLTRQEFTRAVRALSARYVQRRGQLPERSPLDSAGKRAAFALFYAPLHFLTAQALLTRAGVRIDLAQLTDLGCGTGVCGAAWAGLHDVPPGLTGIDSHPWALDEARWNWRTLGLRGHAVRGNLVTAARALLRKTDTALGTTGIMAGWSINELSKTDRADLLTTIDQLMDRGATVAILEPLAREVTPWWDEWAARLERHGIFAGDLKADVDLPAPLADYSDAAGFRKKELGARALLSATLPSPHD